MTQRETILAALRSAGEQGCCLADMPLDVSYTMRNRIASLRADGVPIEGAPCKVHRHRGVVYRYRLAPVGQQAMAL